MLVKIIFLLGLLVSPFIYFPGSQIPYELPKVLFIRIWIGVLLILGLITKKDSPENKRKDWLLIYSVLVFAALGIISSLLGTDFQKSWVGNYYRGDGLFTFLHIVGLTVFLIYYLKKDWVENTVKTIAVSGIVLSFLSILTWSLIYVFGRYEITTWIDNGIGLSFGNPNFLTGYLLLALAPTSYLLSQPGFKIKKILSVVVWFTLLAAILLTKAMAGIVGIFLFILFYFLTGKGKYKIIATISLGLILLGGLYSYNKEFNDSNGESEVVAESRERIYTKGIIAFTRKPILGYGWANFDNAFESVDWPVPYQNDAYVDKAHSSILEVAVTTGMGGLAIYIFIIARTITNLVKQKEFLYRTILVGFLLTVIHMQINVVSISEEIIFWIFVGVAALPSISITPKEESV